MAPLYDAHGVRITKTYAVRRAVPLLLTLHWQSSMDANAPTDDLRRIDPGYRAGNFPLVGLIPFASILKPFYDALWTNAHLMSAYRWTPDDTEHPILRTQPRNPRAFIAARLKPWLTSSGHPGSPPSDVIDGADLVEYEYLAHLEGMTDWLEHRDVLNAPRNWFPQRLATAWPHLTSTNSSDRGMLPAEHIALNDTIHFAKFHRERTPGVSQDDTDRPLSGPSHRD